LSDYTIPDECFYTEQDEWIRIEGEIAFVGVTDYAQQQLGDVVFVELPEVGSMANKDEPFGVIESVKAVSDLYAPLTGKIVAVNEELGETPERVNEDCYSDGGLVQIAIEHEDEIDSLLNRKGYLACIADRPD
jgi:glycine cleavage system H protein